MSIRESFKGKPSSYEVGKGNAKCDMLLGNDDLWRDSESEEEGKGQVPGKDCKGKGKNKRHEDTGKGQQPEKAVEGLSLAQSYGCMDAIPTPTSAFKQEKQLKRNSLPT
mgnify:CR=1 FL=1